MEQPNTNQFQENYDPNEYYKDFEALNEFLKKYQIGPYQALAKSLNAAVQQSEDMVNIWLNFAGKFTDCYFRVSSEKQDFQGITLAVSYLIQILQHKASPDKMKTLIDQFEADYFRKLLGIENQG